ncbi:sulfatase-like hydrolase/transferase [Pseudoflavitalea sp. G-6-1-2]|uniref:LTA synthase family protein n=1 Tax=Pseudoflavitalea sp. G-6-1-2 TaxID=2728841 RepID=UPI00146E134A|nr:alkaline phosphatase family protein [Pseudoflavitalea sp. G-6-1-2]NML23298.1 sulfatase-like hydrolase/transferase [Pseudoflavitalea sp. G-6-1-2]
MKQFIRRLPALVRWIGSIGLIFFILFTLMRLGMYLFFNKQGYSLGQLTDAFFLGARYDLRIISLVLLIILLLGSLPWLHPFKSNFGRRWWNVILTIVCFFLLFFFVVDYAHYAYLVQRLNASVLNYLEDAGISTSMVWQSYPVIRLVLGLLIGTWFIVWLIKRSWRRIQASAQPVSKKMRIGSFIGCFLIFGFLIFGKFNQYPLRWSDAFALGSDYKANLSLNPFESFFNTLKFRANQYDIKKVKEFFPVIKQYYNLDANTPELQYERKVLPRTTNTLTSKPNIVLVICESFSGYKSSMWGNPLNTTPFFDQMCKSGMFFERCFTPTYGTARGVWATLTGMPDVEMPKTASRNPSAVDQHIIINDFTDYEKFYLIGGSTSWANMRGLLTNNIQNLHLYEQDDYEVPKVDVWGISDKNLFLESNKILAKQTRPFFAVIQTADNHRPYTIPEEDQKEFKTINVPQDSLRKYGFESLPEVNAFRYTDFCYQKFIEAASKEKYFDNTLFVFIGDHGIPGNAGTMFPDAWTEQRLTSEHVPLLFYAPKLIAPERRSQLCSQMDVLPTIAGLSNIPYVNSSLGKDLLDTTSKKFAFIFDPDNTLIGAVKGDYFYREQLKTKKAEFVSVVNNNKPGTDAATMAEREQLKQLSEAIYETAKYLLLNNKKKVPPAK